MTLLNTGAYWNRTSGTCYTGQNNTTTPCDFSDSGLNPIAKTLISEAKYYLGGRKERLGKASTFYNAERGTAVRDCSNGGTSCNDKADRSVPYWTGNVGLMYPSDYGYAAGSTCASGTNLSSYNTANCCNTNWLCNSNTKWTIMPKLGTATAYSVFVTSGVLNNNNAFNSYAVRPAVYLSSNVMIKDGLGRASQPFIIGK